MKILVVAATRAELSGIYTTFSLPEADFVQTEKFDILITGVGMTATAFALGRYLSPAYRLVLNLGIAGCYDRRIALGSLLNIVSDEFSELGAEDKDEFLPISALGFGESSYHSAAPDDITAFAALRKVSGITVNKVHGNTKSIVAIVDRLNPTTESMEGAAVFYACHQLSIPCMQIRSISNYVEERNRANWQIGPAIASLNNLAIEFLTNS